jgi:hypothetical protein
MLLDNKAGRSVFYNRNLLTDMTDSKPWVFGGATGGESTVKESEMFLDFGRAGVCDAAVASLLSAGEVVTNGFAVSVRDDIYNLEGGGKSLCFTRKMNPVTGKLMNLYSCTIGDHYDNFVTV